MNKDNTGMGEDTGGRMTGRGVPERSTLIHEKAKRSCEAPRSKKPRHCRRKICDVC